MDAGRPQYGYDVSNRRVMVTEYGANPAEEVTFYGVGGERLGVYRRDVGEVNGQEWIYAWAQASRNAYFGGRLVQSNGKTVVTDRLGSVVIAGTNPVERLRYYPYGEERPGTTAQRG